MTRHFGGNGERRAALLEEAFDSGALVFSEPLLEAVEGDARDEFSGRVRSEHGISYDIERKLGRGGTATVYLARDPKHDRPVAIKVLHADVSARVGAERFVREIRLTARLQHPHVLGLLDSGVFDRDASVLAGRPYYVMPMSKARRCGRGSRPTPCFLSPKPCACCVRWPTRSVTRTHWE